MEDEQIIPDSYDDFCRRFQALATEAERNGIISVSMVMDSDSLSRAESREVVWRGGLAAAVGLCEWGKHSLLNYTPKNPE